MIYQGHMPTKPACLNCTRLVDGYTGATPRPRASDLAICAYCSHVMRWFEAGDVLSLRNLTAEDERELRGDGTWEHIEAARRTLVQFRARHGDISH